MKATLADWVEILLMLLLAAVLIILGILCVAAIFAAPGFVVLAIAGYEDIGYWNSAAAGLGSIILGTIVINLIKAMRGN